MIAAKIVLSQSARVANARAGHPANAWSDLHASQPVGLAHAYGPHEQTVRYQLYLVSW